MLGWAVGGERVWAIGWFGAGWMDVRGARGGQVDESETR